MARATRKARLRKMEGKRHDAKPRRSRASMRADDAKEVRDALIYFRDAYTAEQVGRAVADGALDAFARLLD